MKKLLVFTFLSLFTTSVFSQNYDLSVGLRVGTSVGASIKAFIAENRAIEAIADLDIIEPEQLKLRASVNYQFIINSEEEGLNIFIGPGVSAGLLIGDNNGVLISIDGIAGAEYKFKNSPIALSLDWNPKVQIITNAGIKPGNLALTIRYTF